MTRKAAVSPAQPGRTSNAVKSVALTALLASIESIARCPRASSVSLVTFPKGLAVRTVNAVLRGPTMMGRDSHIAKAAGPDCIRKGMPELLARRVVGRATATRVRCHHVGRAPTMQSSTSQLSLVLTHSSTARAGQRTSSQSASLVSLVRSVRGTRRAKASSILRSPAKATGWTAPTRQRL